MDFTNVNLAALDGPVLDNGSSPALTDDQRYALVDSDLDAAVATLSAGQSVALRKVWTLSRRAQELRFYTDEEVNGQHTMRVSENGVDWTNLSVARSSSAVSRTAVDNNGYQPTTTPYTAIHRLASQLVPVGGIIRTFTFRGIASGGAGYLKAKILRQDEAYVRYIGESSTATVSGSWANYNCTFSPAIHVADGDIVALCFWRDAGSNFGIASNAGGSVTSIGQYTKSGDVVADTLISSWTNNSTPAADNTISFTTYYPFCYGSIADGTYVRFAEAVINANRAARVAEFQRLADLDVAFAIGGRVRGALLSSPSYAVGQGGYSDEAWSCRAPGGAAGSGYNA